MGGHHHHHAHAHSAPKANLTPEQQQQEYIRNLLVSRGLVPGHMHDHHHHHDHEHGHTHGHNHTHAAPHAHAHDAPKAQAKPTSDFKEPVEPAKSGQALKRKLVEVSEGMEKKVKQSEEQE